MIFNNLIDIQTGLPYIYKDYINKSSTKPVNKTRTDIMNYAAYVASLKR